MPHQSLLASRIEAASSRLVLIRAPLGFGAAGAVTPFICQAALDGRVLVAAPSVLVLEQWASRISDEGGQTKRLTADVALELADADADSGPGGVLLATYARLLRGPARHGLATLDLSMMVVDGVMGVRVASEGPVPTGTDAVLAELASRARRTVALQAVEHGRPPTWLASAEIIETSLAEAGNDGPPLRTRVYRAALDPRARAVVERATALLGETSTPRPTGRAWLHSRLLKAAASANTAQPEQGGVIEVGEVWSVLDDLEALGPDPRLAALHEAVRDLSPQGPVWVATGYTIAEAEYVHAGLVAGAVPAALLLSGTRPTSSSRVTVTTYGHLEALALEGPGAVVCWSAPRGELDAERLRTMSAVGSLTTVAEIVEEDGSGTVQGC